ARIEAGIGLAGLLLGLQLFGAKIPVVDFLGQSILDSSLGLVEESDLTFTHFSKMLWHDLGDGVSLSLAFEFASNPAAFRPRQIVVDLWFIAFQRSIVEIRRIVKMFGGAVVLNFHEKQAL